MKNIQSGNDNYKSIGIVGFTHTLLMALDSFGTQEHFNKAQSDWHRDIHTIRDESKRESEIRRAKEAEEAIIAQKSREPRKSLPVPHLVHSFGNTYAHILGGNNRM